MNADFKEGLSEMQLSTLMLLTRASLYLNRVGDFTPTLKYVKGSRQMEIDDRFRSH